MLDTVLEGVSEEVLGTISGLPPGTVTLASTILASTSNSSSSEPEEKVVERNISGLSSTEKATIKRATANLAVTCQRDHPRASRRRCVKFAIKTLLVANKMYSRQRMEYVFRDALSSRHRDRRRLMKTVKKDFKKSQLRRRLSK